MHTTTKPVVLVCAQPGRPGAAPGSEPRTCDGCGDDIMANPGALALLAAGLDVEIRCERCAPGCRLGICRINGGNGA